MEAREQDSIEYKYLVDCRLNSRYPLIHVKRLRENDVEVNCFLSSIRERLIKKRKKNLFVNSGVHLKWSTMDVLDMSKWGGGVEKLYAKAIETDFGICVQMTNCSVVEDYLENDFYYRGDEAPPLTLSWLSSRWKDSSRSRRNIVRKNLVHCVSDVHLNKSKYVYQTQINYRRSANLREGNKSVSEDVLNRNVHKCDEQQQVRGNCGSDSEARECVSRRDTVGVGPKKMWIRHYYLTKGNNVFDICSCKVPHRDED